jgi:ketosteroid isomerase-like protein
MKTIGASGLVKTFGSIITCAMILFWGVSVFGQEWTVEQKEVWESVQARWEAIKNGDVEAALTLLHDENVGWLNRSANTSGKSSTKTFFNQWVSNVKPTTYDLKPINIQIFNNVANVFYAFKWKAQVRTGIGRNLETWTKQNDKWLQISYFGCSCDKLPSCNFDW